MSLADYTGPIDSITNTSIEGPLSCSEEIFPYLIGEKITRVFRDGHFLVLVMESGNALVITSHGEGVPPVFFKEEDVKWQGRLEKIWREVSILENKVEKLKLSLGEDYSEYKIEKFES